MWAAASIAVAVDDDGRRAGTSRPADDGAEKNRGQGEPVTVFRDVEPFATVGFVAVQHRVVPVPKLPQSGEVHLARSRERRARLRC